MTELNELCVNPDLDFGSFGSNPKPLNILLPHDDDAYVQASIANVQASIALASIALAFCIILTWFFHSAIYFASF